MTRVLVCGSNYGRFYVSALKRTPEDLRLAGILARGSHRSEDLARTQGCPLFREPCEVPPDVDLACVAVGSEHAPALVRKLLNRGLHVVCEHPVASEDLRLMLDAADGASRRLHVNEHFPQLIWSQVFATNFSEHTAREAPALVDVVASDRALYAAAAIVIAAGLHGSPNLRLRSEGEPFTVAGGSIGETPFTATVQRTDHRDLADGSADILVDFRIRAVFPTGVLSLLSPAGPVVWTANGNRVRSADEPLWQTLEPSEPATAQAFLEARIEANLRAIEALVADASTGAIPDHQSPGRVLAASRLWEALTRAVGGARDSRV